MLDVRLQDTPSVQGASTVMIRTSDPSGQGRRQISDTAASLYEEPSVARRIFIVLSFMLLVRNKCHSRNQRDDSHSYVSSGLSMQRPSKSRRSISAILALFAALKAYARVWRRPVTLVRAEADICIVGQHCFTNATSRAHDECVHSGLGPAVTKFVNPHSARSLVWHTPSRNVARQYPANVNMISTRISSTINTSSSSDRHAAA